MNKTDLKMWPVQLIPVLLFLVMLTEPSAAVVVAINQSAQGNSNIFAAGRDSVSGRGGGILPSEIQLDPGLSRSLTVANVSGFTQNTPTSSFWGPDGFSFNVNINAVPGLSGFRADRAMALLGVFLDSNIPEGSSPEGIDFTAASGLSRNFPSLAPVNGQIFMIGDGYWSSSSQHTFLVPEDATRLFIGFADAGGFQGNPSNFSDNGGLVMGTFILNNPNPTPEPSNLAMLGITAWILIRPRRRAGSAIR